ncbi:hypothetical protein MMC07_008104 [Pseudocyphellaria aurata]|nr:hypothetical protein [Pseudocyphellaria aurata]
MSLCRHCKNIDLAKLAVSDHGPYNTHHRTFRELKQSAESCPLCAWFVEQMERTEWDFDYDLACEPGDYRGPYYEGVFQYGKVPKLVGLTMMCQGKFATLDVYANEDSVDATQDLPSQPVRPAEDFGAAKRWLQSCRNNHSRCVSKEQKPSRRDGWLPTRVIDVGPMDGSKEPRLLCGPGKSGQYATLSYCWGNIVTVQTTAKTLRAHEAQIPLAGLNKTFRDAVVIARNLKLRYLWIDSLCIIQDDWKDWEAESSMMGDVYSNSAVTIAASSAKNSLAGCFFPRDPSPPVAFDYRSETCPSRSVYFRRQLKDFHQNVNDGPLNRRAWAFQERLLSPRILHYCQDQLHWECEETCLSEDGRDVLPHHYFKSSSILRSDKVSTSHQLKRSMYLDWYDMVGKYTQRDLTNAEDILPALSGLARVFARRTGDRYLAGLWERDLKTGLLWQPSYAQGPRLQRPSRYRAPSWSWAALEGPVSFSNDVSYTPPGEPDTVIAFALRDIVVDIERVGSDPFGMVASGTLTVTGQLKPVEYQIETKSMEYYMSPYPSMQDSLYSGGEKIGIAFFDEAGTHGPLYCLEVGACFPVYSFENRDVHILILKSVGTHEKYARVGVGTLDFTGTETRWFDDAPTKRITLV